jgi:hypothetical protein
MKRFLVGLMVAAMATIGFGGVGAFADSQANWQLAEGSAQGSGGIATFNFVVLDKAHLLYNSKDPALLGDLSTTTMIAGFKIQDVTGDFTYGGEPSCGGTTANVRLAFESIPPGSKFAYTNYWWSNPTSAQLANNLNTSLSVSLGDPSLWSDWNGQFGNTDPAAFIAASQNVTEVGLSFGGGCFFENGVGTTDGSGSFTLTNFTS